MAGPESLSIGEMLELLKQEFPDVTISKIRFLESQGLLDPERTASGYRKFYPADIERLRWILRQQRENFLPLKVIKGRLEAEGDQVLQDSGVGGAEANDAGPSGLPAEGATPAEAPPAPAPSTLQPADRDANGEAAGGGGAPGSSAPDLTEATFTREELARASGLSPADISQLERFGLLTATVVGRQLHYDGHDLVVARLAAAFARHGVEPRHLRLYKNSAEREAGFYEQVALPMLKQRNPAARRRALDTVEELTQLGENLRGALLRRALEDLGRQPEKPARRS
jgi:DNA-binding transcriptional MerR regulator